MSSQGSRPDDITATKRISGVQRGGQAISAIAAKNVSSAAHSHAHRNVQTTGDGDDERCQRYFCTNFNVSVGIHPRSFQASRGVDSSLASAANAAALADSFIKELHYAGFAVIHRGLVPMPGQSFLFLLFAAACLRSLVFASVESGVESVQIVAPAPFSFHNVGSPLLAELDLVTLIGCDVAVWLDGAVVGRESVIGDAMPTQISFQFNGVVAGVHIIAVTCGNASSNVTFTMLPLSVSGAMLPLRFGQHDRSAALNMIGFSKDRPSQLDLLLRSLKEYVAGWHSQRIVILFCASTPDFAAGYERLKAFHRDVSFVEEREGDCNGFGTDFQQQLVGILSANNALPFTLFMVDDMIFKSAFDPEGPDMLALESDATVITLALRMHPSVTHGVSGPRMDDVPAHFPDRPHIGDTDDVDDRKWEWVTIANGDYGYPMSLNGHVYRNSDVLFILKKTSFHNPNLLEAAMSRYAFVIAEVFGRSRMLAPRVGTVVNIPANVVQTTYPNENMGVAAAWFNDMFLAGARLTMHHLRGVQTVSGQSELPLIFYPPSVDVTHRSFVQDAASLHNFFQSPHDKCCNAACNGTESVSKEEHGHCNSVFCVGTSVTAVFSWAPNDRIAEWFPAPEWCGKMIPLYESTSQCTEGDGMCVRAVVPGCFRRNDDAGRLREGVTIAVVVNEAAVNSRRSALRAHATVAWITSEAAAASLVRADAEHLCAFDAIFTSSPSLFKSADLNAPCVGRSSSRAAVKYLPAGGTRVPPEQWRMHTKSKNILFLVDYASAPWEQDRNVLWDTLSILEGEDGVEFIDQRSSSGLETGFRFRILLGSAHQSGFNDGLLDCFLTGTVPIIRGTADATTVFNASGVLLYESLYELIDIVRHSAHETVYNTMINAALDNLVRAQRWTDPARSIIMSFTSLPFTAAFHSHHPPSTAHECAGHVVNAVVMVSSGTAPSFLKASLSSVLGQKCVAVRVAIVIDGSQDEGLRNAVMHSDCGSNSTRCRVFVRNDLESPQSKNSGESSKDSGRGLGHVVNDALRSFGIAVSLPLNASSKTLGGSVVFMIDGRDTLDSSASLLGVATALGCLDDLKRSNCNDAAVPQLTSDSGTSSTGTAQLPPMPWLAWSCLRAREQCSESVAIAFRSDLLHFISQQTMLPDIGRDDDCRSLIARLLASLKVLSGDRIISNSHTTPSAPLASVKKHVQAEPVFDMGVVFNTHAATHVTDAMPLIALDPVTSASGTDKSSYRRLVQFGARVECAANSRGSPASESCRPQITILAPRRGNYFAAGGGSVVVRLLNFWIPEEGSLSIEIDGVLAFSATEMNNADERIQFSLGSIKRLSPGPHLLTALLLGASGERFAEKSVAFGVM